MEGLGGEEDNEMLLHQSRGSLQAALPCNTIAFTSQDGLQGPAALRWYRVPSSPGSMGGDAGAFAEGGAGGAEGLFWGM